MNYHKDRPNDCVDCPCGVDTRGWACCTVCPWDRKICLQHTNRRHGRLRWRISPSADRRVCSAICWTWCRPWAERQRWANHANQSPVWLGWKRCEPGSKAPCLCKCDPAAPDRDFRPPWCASISGSCCAVHHRTRSEASSSKVSVADERNKLVTYFLVLGTVGDFGQVGHGVTDGDSAVRSRIDPSAIRLEFLVVYDDGELASAPAEHVTRFRVHRQLLIRRCGKDESSAASLRNAVISGL